MLIRVGLAFEMCPRLTASRNVGTYLAELSINILRTLFIPKARSAKLSVFRRLTSIDCLIRGFRTSGNAPPSYSYVSVGGLGAAKSLNKPMEQTHFFAGEATDLDQMGTVAGALGSGRRAASQVLDSLRS